MRDDGGPVAAWAERTGSIFDRLLDLDRRSRVMLTFMMSHMREVTGPLGITPARYFKDCYEDVAGEFFQAAENSFVTHHCSRVLHGRWIELVEAARAGGLPISPLEPDVMAGGSLIVPSGYEAVAEQLAAGVVPAPGGVVNEMRLPPLPPLAYWRRTPWTPAIAVPGAPGLPPFWSGGR